MSRPRTFPTVAASRLAWLSLVVASAGLLAAGAATPPKPEPPAAGPDTAEAMKLADKVLKEVAKKLEADKHLRPRNCQSIEIKEYRTERGLEVWLAYETRDSWPDLPSKPRGPSPGNGSVQVKIVQGTAKIGLDTPFMPPRECFYALSVYKTSVPEVKVSLWSMTRDPAAHDRLETVVRARLKAAGVVMDVKPLAPPTRADGSPVGPRPPGATRALPGTGAPPRLQKPPG